MTDTTIALVGTVGGAGATRLSLEFAASFARAGRSVMVVDAAYATQGLATVVPDRIDADLTAVVTDDRPLEAAVTDLSIDAPGRVSLAPARAPFERLARAKTSACARRLAERLSVAASGYDRVLVDVPPVAANQAVAAVTAADRVALVTPDTRRGADALPRARDRLRDVDASFDAVVANRADPDDLTVTDADAAIPESETTALPDAPAAVGDDQFSTAVAQAVETVADVEFDHAEEPSGSLTDFLPG